MEVIYKLYKGDLFMPNIAAFVSYILITTFTPGPNNLMSMANASKFGLKKSIKFNFGVFTGFFVILFLSNVFSSTLYRIIPAIQPVMTFVGASYILYLAYKIFSSKPKNDGESASRTIKFTTGLLLQFVNIKGIVYALTTSSTFITPYFDSIGVYFGFALLLATIALISTVSWGLFGSLFQKFLSEHHKLVNTVMALLLVYTAITIVM